MPPGAVGVAGWISGLGVGAGGSGLVGISSDGTVLELAAEERIAPAAPKAPRRNISLRFNDIPTLQLKRRVYHSMS
jgi:hypothetical protein